jgi:hypothetical protein
LDAICNKIGPDINNMPVISGVGVYMKLSKDEYEKIMKQWDYWRFEIANGHKGSAPRDWFESVLDYLTEDEEKLQQG